MKMMRAMCGCVGALAVLGAGSMPLLAADVCWPNVDKQGRTGNLASTGDDGWSRAIPLSDTVWFYASGSYTPWLDGETLYLNTNGTTYVRTILNRVTAHPAFEIRNGAELIVNKWYFGDDANEPLTEDFSMSMDVRGGSSLHALGEFALRCGNITMNVRENSSLVTDGRFALHGTSGSMTGNGPANISLAMNDSSWTANGNAQFGTYYCSDRSGVNLSAAVTNASIRMKGRLDIYGCRTVFKDVAFDGAKADGTVRAANDGNLRVQCGSELVIDGGTYDNVSLQPGAYSGRGKILFKRGTINLCGWEIGGHEKADALFEIDGDDATVNYQSAYWDGVGFNGTGTVSLVRGTVCASNAGYCRIGNHNSTAVGTVDVSGGLWNGNCASGDGGFYIGETGEGHLKVSGGEVRTGYIILCSSQANSDFRQTGGLVSVTGSNNDNGYVRIGYDDAKVAKVFLDGGVLAARRVYGYAKSEFHANGGMMRVLSKSTGSVHNPYFSATGKAALGSKGLTFDSNGCDVTVSQSFTNEEGTVGLFAKVGNGTLTLTSSSYDVAETAVAGGTLLLGNATPSFDTALVVTNGATFSLVGTATGVTLDGLVVTNGTLALDPTDVITVNGPVDFCDLSISFSTTPDSAVGFLVVSGEISSAASNALKRAYYAATLAAGKHMKLTPVYDAQTGKTTVSFEAADDAAELTATTTWQGSGAWTTAGNWSDGVPTASTKAVFDGTGSSGTVGVSDTQPVGALLFSADGHNLSGNGAVNVASEQGAATLDATEGTNTISAGLSLDALAYVRLAGSTELRLSGVLDGVGLRKTGSGKLVLSGESVACSSEISVLGGTTVAESATALGTRTSGPNRFVVKGDTFEVNEPSGAELTFDQQIRLACSNATSAVVIKTETPAVFRDLTLDAGAIIKRGKARATIEVENEDYLTRGTGSITGGPGGYGIQTSLSFNADGTAPTTGYDGLTIAEGELYVKPAKSGETPTVNAVSCIMIGKRLYEGVSNPTLTVDHVYFKANMGSGIKTFVGYYLNEEQNVMWEPTLRVINGATYYCDSTEMGTFAYSASATARPTMIVEDATLQGTWAIGFGNDCVNGENAAIVRGRNANFFAPQLYVSGRTYADFDNCTVSKATGEPMSFANVSYPAGGCLYFHNGSVFRVSAFQFKNMMSSLVLAFDNATMDVGSGDFTLSATDTDQFCSSTAFSLEMRGTGMIAVPASGKTLTLDVPVTGEGGFVNRGAGTVAFGAGRCQFAGTLVAEAGVIDLSNAGTLANAKIGAGAGTIRGGTFHNATLLLDAPGGAVPTFENCTFTGTTLVTFATDPVRARGVTVANVSGTLTGIGTFRLKCWEGYRGHFALKDARVAADLVTAGLYFIFR